MMTSLEKINTHISNTILVQVNWRSLHSNFIKRLMSSNLFFLLPVFSKDLVFSTRKEKEIPLPLPLNQARLK